MSVVQRRFIFGFKKSVCNKINTILWQFVYGRENFNLRFSLRDRPTDAVTVNWNEYEPDRQDHAGYIHTYI